MPRITYTISDLYAYSMLVDKVNISDEQRKKFDMIEVGDPAPQVIKRKDMADERRDDKEKDIKVDKYAPRRSGPRDNMLDNRRTNNPTNMNERFAPPPRAVRGSGNRNHETFEEGVKYELAQNAAHRKQLNETLAMESGKADAAALRSEGPPGLQQQQQHKDETPKSEELDNLIAGMETEKAANARRSRFFDTASASNNAAAAAPTSSAPATTGSSSTANIRNDWKTADSSIWRDTRPAPQNTGAAGLPAFTTAAGVTNMNINPNVANGFAITGANANANTNANNNNNNANARPVNFGAPTSLPATAVPNPAPASKSPLPGGATASVPTAATNKVWDAAELEKMLRAGATPAAQPPVTGSINAADLERMLMGNAANSANQAGRPAGGAVPAPVSAQPPQQQPVFQGGFPQPAWQTPAKQPVNAMGKMPMQQQPMPQQMQVPMMMNRQFFMTPNGQQFMMAPQQPMFGGGMQQPPAFASTNPQLLYQMQQQMQQQQQQQQAQQNQKRH